MEKANISLTPTEWHLMECLWETSPCTGREAVEYLQRQMGWSRSTTLTLLRRMTEKGLVTCDTAAGVKSYSPRLCRADAVISETESFLSRVYKGSVQMMLSAITDKQALTQDEINGLYTLLQQAEEGRKNG